MSKPHKNSLLLHTTLLRRMALSLLLGISVLACALGIGMMGYHFFENHPWLNAFTNAAMILSGMGPLDSLQTSAGKLFAGCYALFSGLIFISVTGILLVPIAHYVLHKFHLEREEKNKM